MAEDITKYDFIDTLRGYAILGVLLVHSAQSIPPISPTLQFLMGQGARGVQLFYIISAFTLCLSWQRRSGHEISPVRNFFIRRFFRIAPMFYIAIIFYTLWYGLSPNGWAPNGVKWWYVPLTAFFLNGFHPETITSVVPGGWSVAVEMNFYLLLPFLLTWITTARRAFIFFVFSLGAYALSLTAFELLFSGDYPPSQQYLVSGFIFLNFFGQFPVFALGLLSFFAFLNLEAMKRWVLPGGLLFFFLLAVSRLLPASLIGRACSNHFFIGAGFALFAITLRLFPSKVIVNKCFTMLGKISFSMYLTHIAVLEFFSRLGVSRFFPKGDISSMIHFLLFVAVTAALSYPLYASVERFGIFFGKRLINRLERGGPEGNWEQLSVKP